MNEAPMEIFFIGEGAGGNLPPDRVGSKAANLARVAGLGLRMPPAFVLGTQICRDSLSAPEPLAADVRAVVREHVSRLERSTGRRFGASPPLLVSVRSSPPTSMPGMLETVLNVGLTEAALRGLLRSSGNPWLVWDTLRRFAQAYAETVSGGSPMPFVRAREAALQASAAQSIDELDPLAMRDLARESVRLAESKSGALLIADPYAQLEAAIDAVFRSWTTPKAVEYRRLSGLDNAIGTGVVVQAMVFGNSGARSGSGVGFTRNPATGADELYTDFLFNAQGEDVVSGRERVTDNAPLAAMLPDIDRQLQRARSLLEREFRDMQDFEFTVQDGELFFLQSRSGKRTPWAALRIATDLVREQIISPAEALERLQPYDLASIVRTRLVLAPDVDAVASATPAGMGVATGAIVLDCARAQSMAATQPAILVRPDLTTDDVNGLAAAAGVVTVNGGRTSHAAVVARHFGKVCLVGCASLQIDEQRRRCSFGARSFAEGDVITLDGESGLIYAGAVPTIEERPESALEEVRRWKTAAEASAGATLHGPA